MQGRSLAEAPRHRFLWNLQRIAGDYPDMRVSVLVGVIAFAVLVGAAPAPSAQRPGTGVDGGPEAIDGGVRWFWRDVAFDAIRPIDSRATATGVRLTITVGHDFFHSAASPSLVARLKKLHPEDLVVVEGDCVGAEHMCLVRESWPLGAHCFVFRATGNVEKEVWCVASGGDFPEIPPNIPPAP